mmetsp:Transcript_65755/g.140674  ORF Transcript_65755/g.140674 Transcript_65755/m.140674 type:complete len:216 (-) Transcript_65755:333-980(-)
MRYITSSGSWAPIASAPNIRNWTSCMREACSSTLVVRTASSALRCAVATRMTPVSIAPCGRSKRGRLSLSTTSCFRTATSAQRDARPCWPTGASLASAPGAPPCPSSLAPFVAPLAPGTSSARRGLEPAPSSSAGLAASRLPWPMQRAAWPRSWCSWGIGLLPAPRKLSPQRKQRLQRRRMAEPTRRQQATMVASSSAATTLPPSMWPGPMRSRG